MALPIFSKDLSPQQREERPLKPQAREAHRECESHQIHFFSKCFHSAIRQNGSPRSCRSRCESWWKYQKRACSVTLATERGTQGSRATRTHPTIFSRRSRS